MEKKMVAIGSKILKTLLAVWTVTKFLCDNSILNNKRFIGSEFNVKVYIFLFIPIKKHIRNFKNKQIYKYLLRINVKRSPINDSKDINWTKLITYILNIIIRLNKIVESFQNGSIDKCSITNLLNIVFNRGYVSWIGM